MPIPVKPIIADLAELITKPLPTEVWPTVRIIQIVSGCFLSIVFLHIIEKKHVAAVLAKLSLRKRKLTIKSPNSFSVY